MNPTRSMSLRRTAAASIVAAALCGGLIGTSSSGAKDGEAGKEWEAPARASRKKNPAPANKESIEAGRAVYVAECLDCHGKGGAGDGPGARDLSHKPPDLSDPAMGRQSDGAMFWKVSEGREEMPGYDDLLSEQERWHVVNYLRTLAPRQSNTTQPSARPKGGEQ